jgi:hypothetical protein
MGQRRAHFLFHGGNRAQTDGHVEERFDDFFDAALAVMTRAAEIGHDAGQARFQDVGADFGRE